MSSKSVGRNDPCPCGSGKKYKKCCLGRERHGPTVPLAEAASRRLRRSLAGKDFSSPEEMQAFAESQLQQQNQAPRKDFCGLSADEMFRFIHHPFDSPDLISFPTPLDSSIDAPVMDLFQLLVEAIGDQGLKATAKGNLPRQFCRDAARACWGEDVYRDRTKFGGINKEADFPDLNYTRLVANLAGLVVLRKNKYLLSRKGQDLLDDSGAGGIYPVLFQTYTQQFNWAYRDHFPDLHIVQQSFAFTLFLLNRYGGVDRPHDFYENCFLRAFPRALDELDEVNEFIPPENMARIVYRLRALERFVQFFGLASVEDVEPTKSFPYLSRVRKLPLLGQAVRFNLPNRDLPSADEMMPAPAQGSVWLRPENTGRETVRRRVDTPNEVYQFKVTLQEIAPPIWRRFLIPGNASFWDLHVAIQDAMGWTDSHLHEFEILYPDHGTIEHIGIPEDEFEMEDGDMLPGWEVPISHFFSKDNDQAIYRYDFGDGWEHVVALEKILPRDPDGRFPVCLDGERRCPPEDCGGPHGYHDFLAIIADPDHPEHEEWLVWAGGSFAPEAFNPKTVVFDDPVERLRTLDDDW